MGETRKLNQDYIPFFNRNVFFKALNIISIYTFNAMFRQPRLEVISMQSIGIFFTKKGKRSI